MTLVDSERAGRPNGAGGAPMAAPPPMETVRTVTGFQRGTHRLLSRDEIAGLKGEARRLVEGTTLSQHEIARRLDVRPSTISMWKRDGDWQRPDGTPARPDFGGRGPARDADTAEARRRRTIVRLYRVFDRQTADLEARAVRPGATTDEKDARTLAVLAKTLETLIALDRDDGAKSTDPERGDSGDYRAELARTLSRWAEEGGRSG